MDNQLLNKTITVAEIKINNGNVKIIDGQGLTYTIWETKLDKTKTVAYKTYEGLGNISGKYLEIGYDEKSIPDSQGKYRNIKTLKMVAGGNMGVEQGNRPTAPINRSQDSSEPSTNNYTPIPPKENTYNQDKPNWEEINGKKRKDIAEMNAKNNATLLLAHGQIEKNEWEEWCKKIFNYKIE